jgi:hypothetical protein
MSAKWHLIPFIAQYFWQNNYWPWSKVVHYKAEGLRNRTGKGQNQEGKKKRDWGTAGAETNHWLTWQTRRTGNGQTENTGINTQGIMGKMGDTWRGVETITKTGETDQGVTTWSAIANESSPEKKPVRWWRCFASARMCWLQQEGGPLLVCICTCP